MAEVAEVAEDHGAPLHNDLESPPGLGLVLS
jgi:hypothetical protein